MRTVVVLNQFALPRSEGGGTRHVDLFGRLNRWRPVIVAGDRNHYSQEKYATADPRFRLVGVPRQLGGARSRLLGWVAYSLQAFVITLRMPDLALVVGSSPQPLGALAGSFAARLRGVPFVLEVRDLWPESAVAAGKLARGSAAFRVFAWIERHLARRARRIICVTDGWQNHFAALGVGAERLVVVTNGSEPADFEVPDSRGDLRRSASIHGFTAVFAGAHGEKDGIDLVLDAASELPEIHFLLVGSGAVKPAAELRAARERLDNVEFREPVPKAELARLLRACDVGIHAVSPLPVFDRGMSPNKLFDYMAAQLPVVSNARTALSRVMQDGECGRIGGAGDLAATLSAVYRATDDERASWGRQGLEIVRDRHSRTSAARLLEATLDAASAAEPQERLS